MPARPSAHHPTSWGRRLLATLAAFSLVLLPSALTVPSASAEDPGFLEITKGVQGWEDEQQITPGEAFQYTLSVTCTNSGIGGCTNAVLTDALPPWLNLNGEVSLTASTTG